MDELLAAIDRGEVPKSGSRPHYAATANLEFWVGRPVGFGRPNLSATRPTCVTRRSRYPAGSCRLSRTVYESGKQFLLSTNQEGARVVAEIFGDRAFNYAKPLSLIKGLLSQASRPNDIVLDFFAGSGTTGQACSGAERRGQRPAPLHPVVPAPKPPRRAGQDLCRIVCAERMRR